MSPSSSLNNNTSDTSDVPSHNAQLPSFGGFLEMVALNEEPVRRNDRTIAAPNSNSRFVTLNVRDGNRVTDSGRELRPLSFVSPQWVEGRRLHVQSGPEYLEERNLRDNDTFFNGHYGNNGINFRRVEGDNQITANGHGIRTRLYATTANRYTIDASTHARSDRPMNPPHYVNVIECNYNVTVTLNYVISGHYPTLTYAHFSNQVYSSNYIDPSRSAFTSRPHLHERSELTDQTTAPRASAVRGARLENERRCSCRICSRAESQVEIGERLNDTAFELPSAPASPVASSSTSALPTFSNTQPPRQPKRSRDRSPAGDPSFSKKLKVNQLRPAQSLYSETDDGKFICRYVGPACPKPEGCFTPCSNIRCLARHLRRHAKWEVDHEIPKERRVAWNGMPDELLWENVSCRLPDDKLMKCKYYRDNRKKWTGRTLDRYEKAMEAHDAENHQRE